MEAAQRRHIAKARVVFRRTDEEPATGFGNEVTSVLPKNDALQRLLGGPQRDDLAPHWNHGKLHPQASREPAAPRAARQYDRARMKCLRHRAHPEHAPDPIGPLRLPREPTRYFGLLHEADASTGTRRRHSLDETAVVDMALVRKVRPSQHRGSQRWRERAHLSCVEPLGFERPASLSLHFALKGVRLLLRQRHSQGAALPDADVNSGCRARYVRQQLVEGAAGYGKSEKGPGLLDLALGRAHGRRSPGRAAAEPSPLDHRDLYAAALRQVVSHGEADHPAANDNDIKVA